MSLQSILKLLAAMLTTVTASAFAHSPHFDIAIVRSGKSFAFPILNSHDRVATRINRLLQLSELQSLGKGRSRRIFDQARVDDGSIYGGKVWMMSSIYTNNRRVLSLGFDESSCGMTCTYWHRYHTFNPANGDRISLQDLFTKTGYEKFFKLITDRRSSKYRREVHRKVEAEDQESFLGTIGCFENDDLSDFYLVERDIVIDGENCLIKSQKFDGLKMYVKIRLPEFRSFLNNYGRSVFGLSASTLAKFPSHRLPQLFEGSIDGSLPIALVLNSEFELGIRGIYAYLRQGEGIGLEGDLIDGQMKITEYVLEPRTTMKVYGPTRNYIENGQVSAAFDGQRLEGTWTDKDNNRNLSIVAARP